MSQLTEHLSTSDYHRQPITEFNSSSTSDYHRQPITEFDSSSMSDFHRQPIAEFDSSSMFDYHRQPIQEFDSSSTSDFHRLPIAKFDSTVHEPHHSAARVGMSTNFHTYENIKNDKCTDLCSSNAELEETYKYTTPDTLTPYENIQTNNPTTALEQMDKDTSERLHECIQTEEELDKSVSPYVPWTTTASGVTQLSAYLKTIDNMVTSHELSGDDVVPYKQGDTTSSDVMTRPGDTLYVPYIITDCIVSLQPRSLPGTFTHTDDVTTVQTFDTISSEVGTPYARFSEDVKSGLQDRNRLRPDSIASVVSENVDSMNIYDSIHISDDMRNLNAQLHNCKYRAGIRALPDVPQDIYEPLRRNADPSSTEERRVAHTPYVTHGRMLRFIVVTVLAVIVVSIVLIVGYKSNEDTSGKFKNFVLLRIDFILCLVLVCVLFVLQLRLRFK